MTEGVVQSLLGTPEDYKRTLAKHDFPCLYHMVQWLWYRIFNNFCEIWWVLKLMHINIKLSNYCHCCDCNSTHLFLQEPNSDKSLIMKHQKGIMKLWSDLVDFSIRLFEIATNTDILWLKMSLSVAISKGHSSIVYRSLLICLLNSSKQS